MIKLCPALLALVFLGGTIAHAQEPPKLLVPKLRGVTFEDTHPAEPSKDAAALYASPREAALAAFQAGYRSATATEKRSERAMGLFLLSLRRDPTLAKALFNLGILCAQDSRWEDAIGFQGEFQKQPELEPAAMKASQLEVVRLKTILRLEGTAEGKIRRRFDLALWPVLAMTDPIPALNEAARLVRLDKSRWEAPALAGIFHAQTGAFAESVKALDEAVQLAPEDRRANLQLAAGAARREAAFTEQVKKAGLLWEKQQYRPSATAYEAAWTAIPARFDIGMQAATGFLMADQVAAAVKILSLMRESAGGEPAAKVTAMLRELGAVSEEARAASGKPQAENPSAPEAALPARIRTLIGSLASDEVELVAKSAPPLLSDTTTVTPIPDEEVTGGRTDMAFLTTDSIFAMYRRDLTRAAERAGSAAPPAALTAVTPAALITRELPPPPDRPAAAPDAPSRPAPAPERTTAETPAAPAAGSPDSALCRVFVRSKTPGLALFVNGQATGKVTPAEFSWVKGEYEVGIEVGGEIHKVKVSVTEGSFLTLPW